MAFAMKLILAALVLTSAEGSRRTEREEQDPCAGCDEDLAVSYQSCAKEYGNPCAERDSAGLVTGAPGSKKDVSCCMKKEKHDRCMQCKVMDCAHNTCTVNKKYYSEREMVEFAKTRTKAAYEKYDKAAMKAAGWGS